MTAAMKLAQASPDTTPPEPAWRHEEFEALSEDEVLGPPPADAEAERAGLGSG